MLLRAKESLATIREISKVALIAGSSQQGKAFLAYVGSNCVTQLYLSSPLAL